MSISVNISELKSRLSHYLRLVRRGEIVLVRDRDRVIARIDAAGPRSGGDEDARLARLEAVGTLRRGRGRLDVASLPERIRTGADVVGAIVEERSEGR
jgi:antitoxin (DNA-binding transcriptional repressor) of toxin-antitoxin stability system